MNHASRSRGRIAVAGLVLGSLALTVGSVPASSAAPRSAASSRTQVLDDGAWPPFTAPWDGPWKAYVAATGSTKALLGKIALRPRVFWFTSGTQKKNATPVVRDRIQQFQHGDPTSYAQLAVFGMYPNGGEANRKAPVSAAQQATYRRWIDQIATGIGSSKVIIVLEPDLAVAWGGWRPAVRFAMAAYAARKLGALPGTKVYLDGSDADWLAPEKAVTMLRAAGIGDVDGIALGATHYSSTAGNIEYGADLVGRLDAVGIHGKSVVIDTADNAKPFTPGEFHQRFPGGVLGNANICRTRTETRCVTLGIPPTTDVASARWGLSSADRDLAASYVDAYLWFGRPWLYRQASPFRLSRALGVAGTTPY